MSESKSETLPDPATGMPGSCAAVPDAALVSQIPRITSDLIVVLDAARRPAWRNPAMSRRLESLGTGPHEDILADIVARAAEIGAAGHGEPISVEDTSGTDDGTIMLMDRDGRQAWYRVATCPTDIPEPGSEVLTLHDVTSIKHREQNLIEANSMIEHRLNHDPQTGLPNRRRLTADLKRALRAQTPEARVGVVVIEILQFKELTSLHGPDAANEVVQETCFTLLECVDESQIVARTGSHEFVVVFEGCESVDVLHAHAARIHQRLQISVPLDTGDYNVSVRLAVVLADVDQTDSDQLLMDPLVALHHPDTPQSVFIRVYDTDMRKKMENRARIYSELKTAVENDEIEPFYQPQIRIADRVCIGFEVLARWRHPERGLMPPGLFLPIAEDTGLLPGIDDVIMQKSIRALADWRAMGYANLRISLNASGDALRDPTFTDRLKMELDKYDLTPAAASIEILESVLIEDEEDVAAKTLDQLKKNGFHLELDDFGTGYASISTLITLKVDTIKLDRSLIKDLCTDEDSYNIVKSTLALAEQLGVEALAEGVEDDAQMAILDEFKCQFAQGFGIAKPMPLADATAWLAAHVAGCARERAIA